ncbi:MAG: autotransporter outer membrane beta-barrel domain-containing protein, partial [Gammaproteobacteria bacterium]|nr:autotransporter outer membrane beta-barrel domain-containing protein [Gammaproteobacteria bacterium]
IEARVGSGDLDVVTTGTITVASASGEAYGVYVDANHGDVTVVNAGGITALGYYGAYGIYASSSYGDVSVSSVTPGATIVATAEYGDATGISAFARYGGAVDVLNEGAITATVSADFYDYATATGIQAEAGDSYYDGAWTNGTVEVRNTGAITATSGYNAFGIDASSSGGDIAAFNGGSITAVGYEAAGIHVVSASGDVRVDGGEGGSIEVTADYAARGIWASTGGAGTVTVANASSITAVSGDYADGILAYSNSGAVNVSNSGAITVSASDFASGIYAASEYGDVSARNLTGGSISATSAYDIAAGIYAYSNYGGDVDVLNQGSITVDGGEYAAGIYAAAGDRFDGSAWDYGSVEVRNSGSIEATSDQLGAWGILASADGGDVLVVNASSGSISAYADSASGYGIGADAVDGDVSVSNFGRVFAYGEYEAAGIDANSTFGDVGVFSLNTVDPVTGSVLTSPEIYAVAKYGYADGIAAFSVSGDVTVANDGRIGAYSFYSDATGVRAQSVFGDVSVHGGAGAFITADSYAADATGISAIASNGGAVHVLNQGDIVADGEKYATGIFAQAGDYFDGGESGGWVVGTVEVHNSGDIEATAREYDAYGVRALTYGGDILVSNAATGSITATAVYSDAYGIEARSTGGDIDVVNLGSIAAFGDSDAYGVLAASRDGDVGVFNLNTLDPVTGAVVSSGEIHAHAVYDNAVGIDAFSYNGNVTVANEGGIDAYADRDLAIGVGAHSVFGDVSVLNYAGASIMAESGGWDATGVDAYSAAGGSVYVLNEGAIEVEAADDARGIYAGTYGGDVGVFNDGSIDATSVYGDATGIDVRADSGGQAYVRNDGTITVEASQYYGDEAYATGIRAEAGDYFDGGENGGGTYGSVTVRNYGSIDVSGGYDVWGIDASTDQGDILVVNAASGSITLNSGDDSYGGIVARSNGGDITAVNLGDITIDSDEDAYGIAVYAGQGGDAYVYNSGAIDVAANSTFLYGGDEAIGIEARVGSGYLEVVNTGTITVASASGDATGVFASSYGGGEIYVYNSDAISVAAHEEAVGVGAYNTAGDVAVISVAGASISATGGYDATGIVAETKYGDVYVVNEASIDALADEGRAAGIEVTTGAGAYYAFAGGDIGVYNDGDVHAVSMDGFAVGIRAQAGGYGDVYVGNDGTVRAQAEGDAIGIGAYAMAGDVEVFASGNVTAVSTSSTGDADSAGIRAESDFYYGGGDVYVGVDSGTVVSATSTASATGADAYAAGIQAFAYGDVTVVNDGTVTGSATASLVAAASRNAYAAGMYLSSAYGDIAVYNDGTIRATATAFDGLAAAVYLNGEYATLVENHGTLTATGSDFSHAVLSIGASDDTVLNYGTMTGSIVTEGGDDLVVNDGTWNTLGSSDLGDNNDVVFNTADGVINMTNTSIDLGGWSALPPPPSGKSGLRQAPISGIAGNQFVNDGLIVVRGDGVIDMGALNPNAFVNNGIVDFDDGLPNDALTVYGNLAGDGDLLVDLNAATGASDMLYVEGNVVSGTRMRVNGHMDTMPTSADDRIDIMRVSGTSTANVLTVGDITTNADSFVTFGFGVVASINTANTADDVHSLAVSVTGLTGRGALLASLAPAMQNYWHDSLGSLTRRTGVAEPQELGVPTAWVRGFTSDGEVNPELSSGFGSGSTADFDQKLSGTEFGIDVGVTETLRFGLMVSKGDSTVRIADVGSAEIDVDNVGVYATWLGSSGFYVDATYRQMEFETRLRSGSYDDRPDASADGFSLEAGYAWKLDGGLVLKPELLYSQVKVDSLDTISNSYGEFGLADGDSSRLRAGLTMNKTYGDKGKHWTPYAGLFYLTEMDGKNTFDVNGDFQGDVDMNGNSFIGELGVTGQFGKWVLSGGVNYQDGGAFNGVLGGQLAIRYAF